ncbi:MAG: TIGR00730 family Rossman fold protein [Alphaproteobacteria bacterium]|nr:TIGR00730 family Rossman fold protein [Alphaproteobacteria bacterium]
MSKYQNICVYCASSNRVDPKYTKLARDVGTFIASSGRTLVYGGGHVGLMGAAADATLDGGADVIGVIPQCLMDREVAHKGLTSLHITKTMQERQQQMADLSDAFVMLPGGLGTLAEFFEIITWKHLGLHDKPVFILNAFGYWDLLLDMLVKAGDEKFLYEDTSHLFTVCNTLGDLKVKLS